MYHAASKNLRSKLQNKKTEILTQISVLKQEIAEMKLSKSKETKYKQKLHSLKIYEATISITCHTNDCRKKFKGTTPWSWHQRYHKDVSHQYKEYINGKECWFSTNTHLAMQQHLNRYTSTVI